MLHLPSGPTVFELMQLPFPKLIDLLWCYPVVAPLGRTAPNYTFIRQKCKTDQMCYFFSFERRFSQYISLQCFVAVIKVHVFQTHKPLVNQGLCAMKSSRLSSTHFDNTHTWGFLWKASWWKHAVWQIILFKKYTLRHNIKFFLFSALYLIGPYK